LIKKGATWEQLTEIMPEIAFRHFKCIDRLILLCKPPLWRTLEVHVLWGETGVGKTRCIYEREGLSLYRKHNRLDWWDGYICQPAVLFDDFYGGHSFDNMLHWLDGHPIQGAIKNGFVWLQYTRVYITSNSPPNEWYTKNNGAITTVPQHAHDALMRRITHIVHCTKDTDFSTIFTTPQPPTPPIAGNTTPLKVGQSLSWDEFDKLIYEDPKAPPTQPVATGSHEPALQSALTWLDDDFSRHLSFTCPQLPANTPTDINL